MILSLVLIPIVPAASIISVVALDEGLQEIGRSLPVRGGTATLGEWDELRVFHFLFSVLWVTGTILIWRAAVVWTLGRKWLTALVSLIPFAQVIYGQPLWDAGCVGEDILRFGQHEIGIGLWVWIAVWVWWFWEWVKMKQDGTASAETTSRITITPTAQRIVLALGSIPLIVGMFAFTLVALEDLFSLSDPPPVFTVSAVLAVGIWIAIWRRAVAWTPRVISLTGLRAVVYLGIPIGLQWLCWSPVSGFELAEVTLLFLPVTGWGVWMASTTCTWPMAARTLPDGTASSGGSAPRCPGCGYLLIGLRSTRCPECGQEPTLDELWAACGAGV